MKIGKIIIALLLITSMFGSLGLTAGADDYKPQDANTATGIYFNKTYLQVGDTFNATLYLNPGGETVTAWYIWNLTFVWDRLQMANIFSDWMPGFWRENSGGFWSNGTWSNSSCNVTGAQSFVAAGTTDNHTILVLNMTALYPGTMYMNFSNDGYYSTTGVQVSDAGGFITNHTNNAIIRIYPQEPATLVATTYNYTAINLTWTTDSGIDNITICGNTSGYPGTPSSGEVLYNYSIKNSSFNHTDLTNCTTWYYRAWGYNVTTGIHSYLNISAVATTSCYTNISFAGVNPTNGSTYTNCTYSVPVNLTILNSKGKTMLYWINCSNSQTTSGSTTNASVGLTMTSLSHNTTYWWNVSACETSGGDSYGAGYNFKTGLGGGSAPAGAVPLPADASASYPVAGGPFGLLVTDADGDPLDTTFYWSNGSVIGNDPYTPTGAGAVVAFNAFQLAYNTTYYWYAYVNDTAQCQQTRVPSSGTYSFTTDKILVHVTKTWSVLANNTLRVWINASNVGETDLTNGYINETYDSNLVFIGAVPDPSGVDSGRFNITWLNTTGGAAQWFNVTIWLNLSGPVANGTSIANTAKVYFNGSLINTATFSSNPKVCYYATKQANMSSLNWSTNTVTYWINVTNCGDFYMNFVRLNETYSANLSYNSSNYPGNETNTGFNITQIAPGATNVTILRLNTSHDWNVDLVNGTKAWNNFTIHANETNANTAFGMYVYVGARTQELSVTYTTIYYDVLGTTNSIFTILGAALMIGAILTVLAVFYFKKQNEW